MGTRRRAMEGSVAALVVMAPLVAVMVPLRSHLSIATAGLVLVVPVVIGVVVGGFGAGVFGVAAGFLVYDLVFIPPYFRLTVGATQNWAVLVVYVAVMLLVASVVARLETARSEAHQHEEAIRRLFELTDLLIEDRPLSEVIELIVSTVHHAFALRSVALLLPVGPKLAVVASAGAPLSAWSCDGSRPNPASPPAWGIPPGATSTRPRRWRSPPPGAPSGSSVSGAPTSADTTRICCTPSPITWPSLSSGPSCGSRPCAPSCRGSRPSATGPGGCGVP